MGTFLEVQDLQTEDNWTHLNISSFKLLKIIQHVVIALFYKDFISAIGEC